MIRVTITKKAHAAISRTITEAMDLHGPQELEDGRVLIWLPNSLGRALAHLRRPGEDYSQTVMRIVEGRWP